MKFILFIRNQICFGIIFRYIYLFFCGTDGMSIPLENWTV